MVKISIIIPVFNMEEYISECLDSILSQTLKEIEILCVDDGSVDKTAEILKYYSMLYSNIRIFTEENKGPGASRNIGIKEARGEYICIMDADDMYPDRKTLEHQYDRAERFGAILCGGNITDFYPDGTRKLTSIGENFTEEGFLESHDKPRVYGQTRFIYRRDFLIENEIKYPDYWIFEDPPFVMESIMKAGRYYATPECVYLRRAGYKERSVSLSKAKGWLKGIRDCIGIASKYDLRSIYKDQLSELPIRIGEYYFQAAYYGDDEIDAILKEINRIVCNWLGQDAKVKDCEDVKNKVAGIREEISRCRTSKEILVYGTGKTFKNMLKYNVISLESVKSFAVTDALSLEYNIFYGREVAPIREALKDEYDLIIIAAGADNSKKMESILDDHGISDHIIMSNQKINTARAMGFI